MDFASERQDELIARADAINAQRRQASGVPIEGNNTSKSTADATSKAESSDSPLGNAMLYATTLSMLHFTLDTLVHHQYAITLVWPSLFQRTATILPFLFIIVFISYQPFFTRLPLLRQSAFLVFACAAGCWLVRTANVDPYIAVMQRAPGLGTLLVWSFVEMRLPFAIVGLAVVGVYLWWGEYGFL